MISRRHQGRLHLTTLEVPYRTASAGPQPQSSDKSHVKTSRSREGDFVRHRTPPPNWSAIGRQSTCRGSSSSEHTHRIPNSGFSHALAGESGAPVWLDFVLESRSAYEPNISHHPSPPSSFSLSSRPFPSTARPGQVRPHGLLGR